MSNDISRSASVSGQIIQDYAKLVWSSADTLRGAGFKEGDWPKFMMPFFALVLVESRMLRARTKAMQTFESNNLTLDFTNKDDLEEFRQEYMNESTSTANVSAGFHDDLVYYGQGLSHIVQAANPASFAQVLRDYLSGFDAETRKLLGVDYAEGEAHYLDIKGVIGQMEGKTNKPLLAYCRKWAEMDLTQFDSSEITMLEEHLKRRWGDISAETSGEQYTPRDLIELVAALVVDHLKRYPKPDGILDMYDPTCGGGNMLFGVEDAMRSATGNTYTINTFGQELNDQLYALAAIEARFRASATIAEGNTLTNDQFARKAFDVIVANPPYGVDWKDFKDDIEADVSGRFPPQCRPSTSDGQQLFLQHIFHHLKDNGIALVFCSGSTLFSGDAGGGESNARSALTLVEDGVHGIIQMPKNEFFNTGINTYLWFFWKNKRSVQGLKKNIFFLNAEDLFTKLRKSLGSKNSEIAESQRSRITDMVARYESHAIANPGTPYEDAIERDENDRPLMHAMNVDDIHYNKVFLELLRTGEHGALKKPVVLKTAQVSFAGEKPFTLAQDTSEADALIAIAAHLEVPEESEDDAPVFAQDKKKAPPPPDLKTVIKVVRDVLKSGTPLTFQADTGGPVYAWDSENRELTVDGTPLGRAAVDVKLKVIKGKGDTPDSLAIAVHAGRDLEKDSETIPFSSNEKVNRATIDAFLAQWVRDKFEILGVPKLGCEINFNRLFPKGAKLRTVSEIQAALDALDLEAAALATARKSGVA